MIETIVTAGKALGVVVLALIVIDHLRFGLALLGEWLGYDIGGGQFPPAGWIVLTIASAWAVVKWRGLKRRLGRVKA